MNASKPSNARGWYVVFISAFMGCALSASFPQFSMTVKQLSESMNVSEQLLLTSDTIKSAAIVLGMMLAGFSYKILGAKKTVALSVLATVIPQVALPYVDSVFLLMLLKVLQGASSIMFPIFLLIIMDYMSESQRGLSTAVFNGIFYGGGGIGGTFAGIIIANQGWVVSYWAVGAIQLLVGLVWLFTVKDISVNKEGAKEDEPQKKGSLKTAMLSPTVWLLVATFFSTTFVLQAITVDMPLFSSYLGYDDLETGKIMTAVTIGMVVSCLISGKLSDMIAARMENKARARLYALLFGPVIILLSCICLIIAPVHSLGVFFAAVLFFSFGAAWGLGTFYSVLPEIYDSQTLPVITGFSGGIGDVGMPIAPLVVGVIFGVNGMWNIGWGSCAVLACVSIFTCLILCRKKNLSHTN